MLRLFLQITPPVSNLLGLVAASAGGVEALRYGSPADGARALALFLKQLDELGTLCWQESAFATAIIVFAVSEEMKQV